MNKIFFFSALIVLICFKSFALKPIATYNETPEKYGLDYKEYKIPSKDGFILNSWHISPKQNKKSKTILISYGDYGNMSYFLSHANELCKLGYDVVMYDYRGFGASSPFVIDSNQLFYLEYVEDLSTVYNFYQNKITGSKSINFMSLSLGTIITSFFLEKNPQLKEISKIIYEGYVPSLNLVLGNLKTLKPDKKLTTPIKDDQYLKAIDKLKNFHLLNFVGKRDNVCIVDTDKLKENKRWEVVGYDGGHLMGPTTMTQAKFGDLYYSKINNFLSK